MGRPRKVKVEAATQPSETNTVVSAKLGARTLRDQDGLLRNINYKFTPEGFVDWRAMIPKEHLVVNREKFLKKDPPVDVDKLSEEEYQKILDKASPEDVFIKLAGFKELARIRGYRSVETRSFETSKGLTGECKIVWVPNFETDFQEVSATGLADATEENTHGLATKYLTTVVENRAFCRAVRNFLNIHNLSQSEGKFENTEEFGERYQSLAGPQGTLKSRVTDKKISFPDFHQWVLDNFEIIGAEVWEKFEDIQPSSATQILARLGELLK